MLQMCCVWQNTRNAANSVQTSTLFKKIQQNHPNTVNVTDSPRAKKSKRNVDDFFADRETSKASPHSVPPDSWQKSFQSQDFEIQTPTPCPATNYRGGRHLKAHMWYQLSPFPSSNAAIAMQHHPCNIHQSVATPRYSATPWYVLIQLPNVIDIETMAE